MLIFAILFYAVEFCNCQGKIKKKLINKYIKITQCADTVKQDIQCRVP